ncbi:helix-turn-helix transcriptional regulator [Aquincola sp. S2]|uniref:Helix-turn-helix transcriptional regulator n=1 Tax=Pseudaquabacterium terrae TaxID=2732868 RepID=A0ABX2ECQ4_9BURK|nr:helix-turn-helix transcriptional regulator [Aquabacterium terrae]NRF65635.1 helix-turn-helix transcriptional regulator [Aquabacterium terrae]
MNTNDIARIAQLVGEPARTAMLLALMDGRALTALELANAAQVTAPTASRHLALLVDAGLLQLARQGRHRYHRLASREVAQVLEGIMQLAARHAPVPTSRLATGPKDAALRFARSCYDHLAGSLSTAIAETLQADGAIVFDDDSGRLTERLPAALQRLGFAADALDAASRRPGCRPCLDWGERRPHVGGRLGALILDQCLQRGWLRRQADSRALLLTPPGAAALQPWIGAERWRRLVDQPPPWRFK